MNNAITTEHNGHGYPMIFDVFPQGKALAKRISSSLIIPSIS
jgi:hypothetical protein